MLAGASGSPLHKRQQYLVIQGLAKNFGANYSHFGTSTLVWSPELKLAPRYNPDELGEISSEI